MYGKKVFLNFVTAKIFFKLIINKMNKLFLLLTVTNFSILFSGCEFLGDIFKAGIWVGVIIVIAIAAVIGFLIKLFSK